MIIVGLLLFIFGNYNRVLVENRHAIDGFSSIFFAMALKVDRKNVFVIMLILALKKKIVFSIGHLNIDLCCSIHFRYIPVSSQIIKGDNQIQMNAR